MVATGLSPLAAADFSGLVVEDHNGNPLPRAEIRITRPGAAAIVAELETDGQGRFRTPDLPDSEYVLRFAKTDYSTVEVVTRARPDMLLRLTHFGAIAGKISDFEGHPVLSSQVIALSTADAIAGTADANAAPGEYRIYDLPPGSYQVAILTSGPWPGRHGIVLYPNNSSPRVFTVAGGEDYTGADFTLSAGPAFRVSAKADVAGARSVAFTLVSVEHPGRQLAQQLVPVDRPFTVENVLPGNYELLAAITAPGQPSVFGRTPVTVVAANLEEVQVHDQTRSASFTLRTQAPCAADAIVELKPKEAWLLGRPFSLSVPAGSPASLTALAPARYFVTAKASRGDCYATVPPELDLTRDSASRPVEVVLAPPGSMQGHLTGSVKFADYVVVLKSADASTQWLAYPNEKGEFTFPMLPPGPYFALAAGHNTRWALTQMPAPIEVAGGNPTPVELHIPEVSR